MFKKVFTLRFEEEPPYDMINEALHKEFQKELVLAKGEVDLEKPIIHQFEWAKNHAKRLI